MGKGGRKEGGKERVHCKLDFWTISVTRKEEGRKMFCAVVGNACEKSALAIQRSISLLVQVTKSYLSFQLASKSN